MSKKDDDSDDEKKTGYKVSEKVSMDKLLNQDNEDESLRKYKASLGLSSNIYAPKDDNRRVAIMELRVICQDRPGGDIVYDLRDKAAKDKMKSNPFILKEACHYKIKVTFRVQHEIVSGLKYVNMVYRSGIRVAKEDEMLGSYSPVEKPYEVVFPRQGWEEAPSGMLSRGSYTAKSQFVDDDKQCHLEYEYAFSIKKGWDKD
jgi:Rho GDP-dissociation inhibitor